MERERFDNEDLVVPFDVDGGPVRVDPEARRAYELDVLDYMLQTHREAGGLLVGAPGTRTIYDYLPSGRGAKRGAASYSTDPEHLQPQLEAAWRRHGGDAVGYLHSHPWGHGVPSQQDLLEAARMLADPDYRSMNEEVLLPIAMVQVDPEGLADPEVVTRWFVYRRDGRLLEVAEEPLPRRAAIDDLEHELQSAGFTVSRHILPRDGLVVRVEGGGRGRHVLLLPPTYPQVDPRLFTEGPDGGLEEVPGTWSEVLQGADSAEPVRGEEPAMEGLPEAFFRADTWSAPTAAAAPRVLVTDRQAAAVAGFVAVPAERRGEVWAVGQGHERVWLGREGRDLVALLADGHRVVPEVVPLATDFQARAQGLLVPSHLATRTVLVVGCGSVGSMLSDQLVRAGVGTMLLVDPDRVAAANLSRSVYGFADLGRPKVEALVDHLRRIHPHVVVECHATDVRRLPLGGLLAAADLVVVAVDRPEVIQLLDLEVHPVVAAVYPGIYAKGAGGEVLYTWPGSLPLSAVLEEVRFAGEPPRPNAWNYDEEGRLAAEPALGAQIAHVVAAAALVSLALLSEGTPSELARLLDRRYQGVFIANQRGWIFDYPLQAVWAQFDGGASASSASGGDDQKATLGTQERSAGEHSPAEPGVDRG